MQNEAMYLEIINNLRDGVYFVDANRRINFWNKAAEEITGHSAKDMLGKLCHETRLQHINAEGKLICVMGCPLFATLEDGQQRQHEVFVRHRDGHRIPIKVNIFPITEEGKIVGAIEIFTKNSPNVYEEELIEQLANFATRDKLTGIPNRRSVESYIEFRIAEMKRFNTKFCVVFLDIDNFGKFNNTYGHELGDEVLKTVSKSAMHTIRRSDLFGRWGGEEFIGVFEVSGSSAAVHMAEKIRALIANSEVDFEGQPLRVTASLGVTIAQESDTIESVVKRADDLMYLSKQAGKNRVTSN
ncbi:MAG: sensor domain-containing diguanylate cyclase [Firmicutes bacterium]|nr:sensor domain-containing diguanylate cyclase [Bacillota bacterium]